MGIGKYIVNLTSQLCSVPNNPPNLLANKKCILFICCKWLSRNFACLVMFSHISGIWLSFYSFMVTWAMWFCSTHPTAFLIYHHSIKHVLMALEEREDIVSQNLFFLLLLIFQTRSYCETQSQSRRPWKIT
jgi:hypothetical protein